jgi:hypothetical protein
MNNKFEQPMSNQSEQQIQATNGSEFESDLNLHGSESEYGSEFESGTELESDLKLHCSI